MEGKIFPSPEVLRVLAKSYVEVRLHTDNESLRRLKEVRFQGDVSIPAYEIVDPATGARVRDGRGREAVFKGADLPSGRRFLRFLSKHAAARG